MSDVLRILDVNLNRAREAIRVLEDAARFLLDDQSLTMRLKSLRHRLTEAAETLPDLTGARDTPGDVGTDLTTSGERTRSGLRDVVIAAAKRLGEALRSLEEYGKLVDSDFAATIKQLRYTSYDVEAEVVARVPMGAPQWKVCLLLTESLCDHRSWREVAVAAVAAGVDAIQLREKSLTDAALLTRAHELVGLAGSTCAVIINDRPDIALLCGAAAVHLGQDDLAIAEVRRLVGRRLLIGVSTHDHGEAARAIAAGADYCGVGAMFATGLKPDRVPSGVEFLRTFIAAHPHTPHLAIGGITPDNVSTLVGAGGRGIAVSSAVCGASDPGQVIARLRKALDEGRSTGDRLDP